MCHKKVENCDLYGKNKKCKYCRHGYTLQEGACYENINMNDNTIFRFNQLQDSLSGKALSDAKGVLLDIMRKFKPYIRKNNLRIKIDGYRGFIEGLDGARSNSGSLKYRDLPKRRAERIKSLIEELAQNPVNGM